MRSCFAFVLAAAAFAWPAASIPAESPKPDQGPLTLSLAYDGVLVVKVLDMKIDQQIAGDDFTASASLKSSGLLSLFKKIDVRAQSEGPIEAALPQPLAFNHVNADGKANRRVKVRWQTADVTTAAAPAYHHMGEPAPTPAQKLAAADPLTQLTRIALTSPARGPCRSGGRFFDGRQLYQVDFGAPTPRPLSRREQALGLSSPVACVLTFNEVAGFDAKPPEQKNQGLKRPMTIDFAAAGQNGPWIVSAVRGKTPLGEARIELTAAKVAGAQIAGTSLAGPQLARN